MRSARRIRGDAGRGRLARRAPPTTVRPLVTPSRRQDRCVYFPLPQHRAGVQQPQLVDVADLTSRHDLLRRHPADRERYAVILEVDQGQKTGATRQLDRRHPIYFDDFASFMTQYRAASHGCRSKIPQWSRTERRSAAGCGPRKHGQSPLCYNVTSVVSCSVTTSPQPRLIAVPVPSVDPIRTRAPQTGSRSSHHGRLA
jgi:hypothetical protein